MPWVILATFPQVFLRSVRILIPFEGSANFTFQGFAALTKFLEAFTPRPLILAVGVTFL